MPNPATPTPTNTNWLADVEGADVPFDQLFGTNPEATVTATTETQTTTTSANASQTTPTPQDVRPPETNGTWRPIKAQTGTVYNTYEDTVRGIEEKDSLIAQLREQLRNTTGQDPIAAQRHTPQPQTSYLNDPSKYAKDLAEAAQKGDAKRYMEIQLQLQDEYIAPYKPLLQEVARSNARTKVQSEVKDFETFVGSDDYSNTLNSSPALKTAITAAESDLRYASQLNELYRLAYDSYVARVKLPKLIEAAQTTSAAPTTPVARPPVTPSTLTPAQPTTAQSDSELMQTAKGRQELMARFRAQGLDNVRF